MKGGDMSAIKDRLKDIDCALSDLERERKEILLDAGAPEIIGLKDDINALTVSLEYIDDEILPLLQQLSIDPDAYKYLSEDIKLSLLRDLPESVSAIKAIIDKLTPVKHCIESFNHQNDIGF